jgi:creatinine amidohydrolase
VALTQYLYPTAIKTAPLSEKVAKGFPIYGAEDFRHYYPDGRMGSNPALATPEHGERFYTLAVEELRESYRQFLQSD